MNRETSDKFNSRTQADLTSGNATWQTPPVVYKKLNEDFGPFDLDLTADASNHLCPRWFGPDSPVEEYDALSAPWIGYGRNGYSNPSYGPFVQRMLAVAKYWAEQGFFSTLLLPMRVTEAFKEHVITGAAQLLFCDSRITFFEGGVPRLNEKKWREDRKAMADPAMFDSIIVRYCPGWTTSRPIIGLWEVPKHVSAEDLQLAVQMKSEVVI